MRLEELLFCTVFFLVPVMGMAVMVIARVLKEAVKGQGEASNKQRWSFEKREKSLPSPVFENHEIMDYQVESSVHILTQFNSFKEDNEPRAGPWRNITQYELLPHKFVLFLVIQVSIAK